MVKQQKNLTMEFLNRVSKSITEKDEKFKNMPLEELGEWTFKCGKHKDETFSEVFKNDNDYAVWVYTNKKKIMAGTGSLKHFISYIDRLLNENRKKLNEER